MERQVFGWASRSPRSGRPFSPGGEAGRSTGCAECGISTRRSAYPPSNLCSEPASAFSQAACTRSSATSRERQSEMAKRRRLGRKATSWSWTRSDLSVMLFQVRVSGFARNKALPRPFLAKLDSLPGRSKTLADGLRISADSRKCEGTMTSVNSWLRPKALLPFLGGGRAAWRSAGSQPGHLHGSTSCGMKSAFADDDDDGGDDDGGSRRRPAVRRAVSPTVDRTEPVSRADGSVSCRDRQGAQPRATARAPSAVLAHPTRSWRPG